MIPRSEWQSLIKAGGRGQDVVLTDIGTTSLTGVRVLARPDLADPDFVAHPVMQTVPLGAPGSSALGSDFVRVGLLYPYPEIDEDSFTDALGIEWLVVDGTPTPSRHPLEEASLAEIARHPRPKWPQHVQIADSGTEDLVTIADPPCPGLLDMSFGLRGHWACLNDITSNWRSISALLDWSLETIVSAYEQLLNSLPKQPDIVVYGDDLGFQQSMYVSEVDFRNFLRPRMKTLFSRIRRLTPAKLLFHSCGAVRPILPDIADLGVDIVNLDSNARGMILDEIRGELPRNLILHGSTNLVGLGQALREGNKASVAQLVMEIVNSAPVVAAPLDNLSTAEEVGNAQLGAECMRQLAPDDVYRLRRYGPVRSVIEDLMPRAMAHLTDLFPSPPRTIRAGAAHAYDAGGQGPVFAETAAVHRGNH